MFTCEMTWLVVTSVLASIDVGRAVDKDGVPLDPKNVEYIPHGSFKCEFIVFDGPCSRLY